jgi:hypothetical protein
MIIWANSLGCDDGGGGCFAVYSFYVFPLQK